MEFLKIFKRIRKRIGFPDWNSLIIAIIIPSFSQARFSQVWMILQNSLFYYLCEEQNGLKSFLMEPFHFCATHSCSFCLENLAKNSGSFCYKNLLFHKVKHSLKWSSGVPYCSLLKPMSKDSF